jgi:molybdopterin-guanine dinucleotide biosynthesis protein A
MTKRAALILAGGKARRFQSKNGKWQDKALAELFGKPLLLHAVNNVRGVVEKTVICVDSESRKTQYTEVLTKHHRMENVTVVIDEKINHTKGPNVAIFTGLKAVDAEYCFTLPCDMPMLEPKVVDYLFNVVEDSCVAVPMWPNSRLETLVMVLERNSALEITDTLCHLRHPRSDDIIRGASNVLFVSANGEIKTLDPELKSFVNINSVEDLTRLQTRYAQGPVTGNMRLNLGTSPLLELQRLRDAAVLHSKGAFVEASRAFSASAANLEMEASAFWAGISRENEGESLLRWSQQQSETESAAELDFKSKEALLKAADNYRLEAEMYEKCRCRFLAERARADKAWCESWTMGKLRSTRYPSKWRVQRHRQTS